MDWRSVLWLSWRHKGPVLTVNHWDSQSGMCVCVGGVQIRCEINSPYFWFSVGEAGATILTHHSRSVWVSIEELLYPAPHPPSPLEVESVEVRAPSAEAEINSALQPSEAQCLAAHNNSASKIAS